MFKKQNNFQSVPKDTDRYLAISRDRYCVCVCVDRDSFLALKV